MSFGQLVTVFDLQTSEREVVWEDVKEEINRRRAAKGLPPMRPMPKQKKR
jgi:hypothetical protein